MSTVAADHRPDTAPATSYYTLSTRQECTTLAQAITIRARVKLAQAYASLYEGWVAEDQAVREVTKAAAVALGAAGESPAQRGAIGVEPDGGAGRPADRPHVLVPPAAKETFNVLIA